MILPYSAIAEQAILIDGPNAQQKAGELAALLELISDEHACSIVEIGCYYGGTAWAISLAFPEATLICVDNNSLDSNVDTAARLEQLNVPAHFIFGDSTHSHTCARVRKIADPVDLVFIDGSHYYRDVKRDWELYSSITRPGGIVVLADIIEHAESTSRGGSGSMDVNQLWAELEPHYETRVIATDPPGWGNFGVIRMPA